tara:strand:+ start:2411 stop:5467 length:3057 start_codon:yes stop_codon:yes gene_type:complete
MNHHNSAGESLADPNITINAALASGIELQNKGQLEKATEKYKAALVLEPENPDALHLLGIVQAQLNRVDDAIALITRAIEKRPRFSEALYNIGRIYQSKSRPQEAINAYVRAARFRDGYSDAWYNLGCVYSDVGMFEEALAAFEAGLTFDPKNEEFHDAICRLYKSQGLFEECIEAANRGLNAIRDSAHFLIHRSEACFALGRLEDGWRDYAARTRHPNNPNRPRHYDLPQWEGEDLTDKTILVITEQGPGETFLFSTMLPDIVSKANKCIVVTSDRLRPILQRSFPDAVILSEETTLSPPDEADVQVSLVDLGLWLRPAWESFPKQGPHIVPDPKRVAEYRERYKRLFGGKLIVGIAWRTQGVNSAAEKSTHLESWKPILFTPGVAFVSLQYGDTRQEIANIDSSSEIDILTEPEVDPLIDLDGHLAQIAALDLVISTSNTAAHAAAAQGVPTWCMLSNRLGDGLRWTWFWDQVHSPWYSDTRLYRQIEFGNWSVPIANIAVDLNQQSATLNPSVNTAEHLLSLAVAYRKASQYEPMGLAADAARAVGSQSSISLRLSAESRRLDARPNEAIRLIDEKRREYRLENSYDLVKERALSLIEVDQATEAIDDLERAALDNPDNASILLQLGNAHHQSGNAENALTHLERALSIAPQERAIRKSMAAHLLEIGRTNESVLILDSLLAEDPTDVDAAATRGIALLSGGDFLEGWPAYQNRLRQSTANISYARFPHKNWQGESLAGAHVLVWTEQGVGEELLVSTLIPELTALAQSVTLLCSSRMVQLFKRSFLGVNVEERKEPLSLAAVNPKIDFQMSLSDLGSALRPSVRAFTDSKVGCVLIPKPELTKELRGRYRGNREDLPLVGLSWQSTAPYLGRLKSLDINLATKFVQSANAAFVSLQYSPDPDHLKALSRTGREMWIHDPAIDALESIDRAAAQIAAMDYVVTVSNSTAHLAGALGIPTALLVPQGTGRHWYWLRNQDKSLWYKSVQQFETVSQDGWARATSSIAEIIDALGQHS